VVTGCCGRGMGCIDGMDGPRVPVSKHLAIGYGIAWIDGQRVKQTKAYHLFLS